MAIQELKASFLSYQRGYNLLRQPGDFLELGTKTPTTISLAVMGLFILLAAHRKSYTSLEYLSGYLLLFFYQWRRYGEIDASESCFYYRPSETHETFTNIDFTPTFDPEDPSITPQMIEDVCGTNIFCAFDLRATGDPALAATTAFSLNMAMSVLEANEEAGIPCPPLANPANGIVVINDATVGGTATYSCNEGFSLTGNMVRVFVLPPLSCIIQRPSVGIKEDVSVFVYGLPGLQSTPDAVKLRRALKNPNELRVPPSKERTVGRGTLCEIPLPSAQRGGRFGVFACETIENGYVTNSVKAVITSVRKCLLPADGRVTRTVNYGEEVLLRVTLPNGPLSRLRWTKDGSWRPQWYRRPAVTLQSVTLNDEGVYEIFQRGRRNRGLQAIIILYVRACHKGFYGFNCNQPCTCQNGGLCDELTGECICPPGFSGSSCEEGKISVIQT
ncbi:Tyrosine-protein kinase receptor Tie-2 [Holothuria leucospilota]|uniref:Tyrosine-protein kinase receptor Tie-2 n=1 Tax=Holothuria leucospilota TaxID=206669 RepID=A0A9Q1HD00_HOLLE|nr:Tyrosine-protein kinase receptor Tie-2 [Holothuria leucospilota]